MKQDNTAMSVAKNVAVDRIVVDVRSEEHVENETLKAMKLKKK